MLSAVICLGQKSCWWNSVPIPLTTTPNPRGVLFLLSSLGPTMMRLLEPMTMASRNRPLLPNASASLPSCAKSSHLLPFVSSRLFDGQVGHAMPHITACIHFLKGLKWSSLPTRKPHPLATIRLPCHHLKYAKSYLVTAILLLQQRKSARVGALPPP